MWQKAKLIKDAHFHGPTTEGLTKRQHFLETNILIPAGTEIWVEVNPPFFCKPKKVYMYWTSIFNSYKAVAVRRDAVELLPTFAKSVEETNIKQFIKKETH